MKLNFRMENKRMMLCALFSLCGALSHSAETSAEPGRKLPHAFGELRKFSASSLPKLTVFKVPAEMAGQPQTIAPTTDAVVPIPHVSIASVHSAVVGPASDIGPYLRVRSPLVESDRIINRADFSALAPSIRRPLKVAHGARTGERDVMLPEADWIDESVNNHLGPWKERLDADLEKLDKETESYVADVATARSKCMPAKDDETWQWCLNEKTRLQDWKGSLFNRGEEHNAELAKFHLESKPYDSRLATLIGKIESWELAVYDLIGRIKKALNEEPDTEVRTCTDTRQDALQDDIDEKCKGKKGERRACKGDQSCDALYGNLAKNQACYAARVKIVDECYGGKADPGHKEAIEDALNATNLCLDWIKKRCGGVGAGSVPL